MSFLTAEWRKLILVNYVVDPDVLTPFIPKGTAVDLFAEKCFVSLVGFMFLDTRVMGMKIPYHINFEEVNLRFYVRPDYDKNKRGVAFIKEIVPRVALSTVANLLYREHYQALPMRHNWSAGVDDQTIEYEWALNKNWQLIKVKASKQSSAIIAGSEAEFITEHYWGYTRVNDLRTYEYEVTHPTWVHYPVTDLKIDVDFALTYGKTFSFLQELNPDSVFLAEGSKITVEQKRDLVF